MAHLIVFEPSAEREVLLLEQLRLAQTDLKIFKELGSLQNQLDGRQTQIVVIDLDHLETDAEKFIEEFKLNYPNTFLLGVTTQPEEEIWQLSVRTQTFIVPLNRSLIHDLPTLIKHCIKSRERKESPEKASEIAFIGQDPSINKILNQADLIANTNVHVLITGETGSGKTILAKLIHEKSTRRNLPFIHLNCAAIPEQLLEAELFGFRKGSFTGAVKDTPGKFKAAAKGTIFLDEIGEMPVHLQAKLLKVLDEGQYYPIGSVQTEEVHARIIAATNKDIWDEIARKRFRMDLYYRLNSFEIHIPALKERIQDIPLLFNYYIDNYIKKYGTPKPEVQPAVYEILKNYSWPGNIRELQNLVETLMYMKPETITLDMMPQKMFDSFAANLVKSGEDFRSLEEIKKDYAYYIWQLAGRNKSKAAKILGVDIKTFRKLLNEV